MYTKKHRALAFLACATILIVTLFSVLFIVREADHDCIGEGCPICVCIRNAEHTLKQLGMGFAGTTGWMPAAALLSLTVFCVLRAVPCETPISQKVRLND